MNATTTAVITAFASSTGTLMTDAYPYLIYIFGFFVALMAWGIIYKGFTKGIKKIY